MSKKIIFTIPDESHEALIKLARLKYITPNQFVKMHILDFLMEVNLNNEGQ